MKKVVISLIAASLALSAAHGQNQFGSGDGSATGNGSGYQGGFDIPPPPDGPPPPMDFSQVEVPQEILDLRTAVVDARDLVRTERAALIESLGEEATPEDVQAALQAWRALPETEAAFDDLRSAQAELREAMKVYRPVPPVIEVPEEIQAKMDDLKGLREDLKASREMVIQALGEDATDEEIRAALEDWRTVNVEAIDATKALAEEVRAWHRENRPQRDQRVREGIRDRRQAFRENAVELRQAHRGLREELANPDLTPEQRREMIRQFREEQRDLLKERKQLRRGGRFNDDGEGGERRPG